MNRFQRVKLFRIISQVLFFGLFVYVFVRSLDPFRIIDNPFLTTDPLIQLTHLQLSLPWLAGLAGLVVLALLFGRVFCGWICPLGALIDGLDRVLFRVRKLFGVEKKLRSRHTWLIEYPPSWFLLGAVFVAAFFAVPLLQFLHPNVWIIRIFALTPLGIGFAALLIGFSLVSSRLWCTYICPLGALYGVLGKASVFKLGIQSCSACGRCSTCPTRAADYRSRRVVGHQCILCFHFEARCPVDGFRYGRRSVAAAGAGAEAAGAGEVEAGAQANASGPRGKAAGSRAAAGATENAPHGRTAPEIPNPGRRSFLIQGGLLVGGAAVGTALSALSERPQRLIESLDGYLPSARGDATGPVYGRSMIRPPGVLDESRFAQRCLRCFQCVRSCPNDIIKISRFQGGMSGAFTPRIEYGEYGCDYYCQVCQEVCPNYAIPLQTLEQKQRTKMGLSHIDENVCVVYAEDTNCLVCEEFCPVPEKAIKIVSEVKMVNGKPVELRYPVVNPSLCIGCGVCQVNCPTRPQRAITVSTV
jgi:polyferredoxin